MPNKAKKSFVVNGFMRGSCAVEGAFLLAFYEQVCEFQYQQRRLQRASLILQVSDASSRLSAEQDAQVEIVLKELEAEKKPRLRVRNKVDLLDVEVAESLVGGALLDAKTVYVSAAEGTGMDRLLARIDAMIEEDPVSRVHLRVPQKEGKTLAMLEAKARIYSRTYKDGAVQLEVEAPESVVRRVREWAVQGVRLQVVPK